jgi:hypothetical protein
MGYGLRGSEGKISMLRCRLTSASLVTVLVLGGCASASAGGPRALLELFTSQGCSSCPAADKLLGELAADPSLVAISVPIDYWDYLGWKDTLADPADSARQRAYAHVRGDRQVYTPQMVVNGATHVVGSDHNAIERAIVQTEHNPAIMSIPVLLSLGGHSLDVKITGAKEHFGGEVWLCPLAKSVPVAIGRGENRGRTITYHNVVRHWLKLGDFSGSDLSWSVPVPELVADESDEAVVLVQQGTREKPGPILGAALAPLTTSAVEAH